MTRTSRPVAAVAAAAVLVLAACSTTPEPVTLPTFTASPSASAASPEASPTPADPTPVPSPVADLTDPSSEGAVAAAVYFAELYGYTLSTGDLSAWREISDPECAYCQDVADEVTAGGDYTFQGGGTRVLDATVIATSDAGDRLVQLTVEQDPWESFGADGSEASGPGGLINADAVLSHDGATWTIVEFDAASVDAAS